MRNYTTILEQTSINEHIFVQNWFNWGKENYYPLDLREYLE